MRWFSLKTGCRWTGYGYEAIYLIMLALAFAWGGDSSAYFAGRFWQT